jgi:membrane-associated phospholipid phosphatase
MPWQIITHFGDSAVLVPTAGIILLWLAINARIADVGLWSVLFAALVFIVVASKVLFLGWGFAIPRLDFANISGHAALATAILPLVCNFSISSRRRPALTAIGYIGAAAIAVSRYVLGYHSLSESIAGYALGAVVSAAVLFFDDSGRMTPPRLPPVVFAAAFAAILAGTWGIQAPTERMVVKIALFLSGHSQPFTRHDIARRYDLDREPLPAPPILAAPRPS